MGMACSDLCSKCPFGCCAEDGLSGSENGTLAFLGLYISVVTLENRKIMVTLIRVVTMV